MHDKNLFISHSWKYNSEYEKLIALLNNAQYFSFKDYSVPSKDPLDIYGTHYKAKLRYAIENQMKPCSAVLLIAGKYVTFSDSIQMEIDIAKELNKPIIAIRPYGADQISSIAEREADVIVNWNTESIKQAIRFYSL